MEVVKVEFDLYLNLKKNTPISRLHKWTVDIYHEYFIENWLLSRYHIVTCKEENEWMFLVAGVRGQQTQQLHRVPEAHTYDAGISYWWAEGK